MKSLYFKVVAFFHNLYVRYLLWSTSRVVSKANKAEQKMMSVLKGDPRYYQYLVDRTHRLIGQATTSTAELLPYVGKDPNYVPPPPPPPAPVAPIDETRAAWIVDLKNRPTRMAAMNTGDAWVKNPVLNPVYQSRLALEAKAKADAEEKAKKDAEAEATAKEEFLRLSDTGKAVAQELEVTKEFVDSFSSKVEEFKNKD